MKSNPWIKKNNLVFHKSLIFRLSDYLWFKVRNFRLFLSWFFQSSIKRKNIFMRFLLRKTINSMKQIKLQSMTGFQERWIRLFCTRFSRIIDHWKCHKTTKEFFNYIYWFICYSQTIFEKKKFFFMIQQNLPRITFL